MRRRNTPTQQPRPLRPRRWSQIARMWSELIKPALIIAALGLAAVLQISACARVSVIEWDLRRLEAQERDYASTILDLNRQLADLRAAQNIREHIRDRRLTKETAVEDVTLTGVPEELLAELPRSGGRIEADVASAAGADRGEGNLIAAVPKSP